jgi:hypothetical protein
MPLSLARIVGSTYCNVKEISGRTRFLREMRARALGQSPQRPAKLCHEQNLMKGADPRSPHRRGTRFSQLTGNVEVKLESERLAQFYTASCNLKQPRPRLERLLPAPAARATLTER